MSGDRPVLVFDVKFLDALARESLDGLCLSENPDTIRCLSLLAAALVHDEFLRYHLLTADGTLAGLPDVSETDGVDRDVVSRLREWVRWVEEPDATWETSPSRWIYEPESSPASRYELLVGEDQF